MKAVIVMFDTLSRRYLSTYGNDWVPTPNFKRLEEKCCVFDQFYCGSLPCMPARRELHTGRYNFLHRSWGPIEPFDDSAIELLKAQGVYTHIVTDHSHYWEDGGATYLTRYNSWEGFRGQEGDRWVPIPDHTQVTMPKLAACEKQSISLFHNFANRTRQESEETMSTVQTVQAGLDFMEKYHDQDQWLLQIEAFDPHEPFYVPQKYLDLVKDTYQGDYFDWPAYKQVSETKEECEHLIKRYGALIAMCDEYLGKVLDVFDRYDLWKDTMLIVNTDHGFLMGEHDWWGKNIQPQYGEIAHLPFYLHHPGIEPCRSDLIAQTIDIEPTLLDAFNQPIPETMQGKSLLKALSNHEEIRDYALYGTHGGHVNIVNKETLYMRAPANEKNEPLYQYTLMPTNMRGFFPADWLKKAELVNDLSFTKGNTVLKMPVKTYVNAYPFGNLLFDLKQDPKQCTPLKNEALETKMIDALIREMHASQADEAQYIRLGLKEREKEIYE